MKLDLDKLEKLAKAANDAWLIDLWRSCNRDDLKKRMACNEFVSALSPDVVLELIAEVRRLDKITREWAEHDEKLRAELGEANETITNLFPSAVWFLEGPYGRSPEKEDLIKARSYCKKYQKRRRND